MTPSFRRFIPLLLGYWGLRAFLLITDFDQYAFPTYEMSPVGIIGSMAASGWRGVPLHNFFDNCGGHLLWGLMTAPVFKVFGSSYMALKILPLVLGAIDLWLIWNLAGRLFGKVAASVASLAFILAPPTLLIYSMLAKGNHFEGLTLQLLTTWFWVRGSESERHRFRFWSVAAFCAGLSVFAYSGSAIWVALLLFAHLIALGLPSWRETLTGSLGFVVGLSPLLWVNIQTGRLQLFLDHNLSSQSYFNRLVDLGHNVLLAAPGFGQATEDGGRWLGVVWWGVYIIAWSAAGVAVMRVLRRTKRASTERIQLGLLVPLLGYLPGFALVYCLTDFRFRAHTGQMVVGQFRYLVPHLAFACLLFGVFAQWVVQNKTKFRGALSASLSPIGLGILSTLMMASFGSSGLGVGFHYPASDKADIARFLLRDGHLDPLTNEFTWDFERLRSELDDYDPADRERIVFGLGREMLKVQGFEQEEAVFELERILIEIPEALRPAAARGVGAGLSQDKRYRFGLRKHLLSAHENHPEHAPFLAMGISSFSRGALSRDTLVDFNRANRPQRSIPYPLRAAWREGQGEFCGALLARGFDQEVSLVMDFLPGLPKLNREDFWRGVETAWAARGLEREELLQLRRRIESDASRLASTPTR